MFNQFRVDGIHGKPRPIRGFDIAIIGTAQEMPSAYVLGLDGRLSFGGQLVCENVSVRDAHWHGHDEPLIERGQDYTLSMFARLTPEAIAHIEALRIGVKDLDFSFELLVRSQDVDVKAIPGGQAQRTFGAVHWVKRQADFKVSFEIWNQCLRAMDWRAWDLVELPSATLEAHPRLDPANKYFDQARVHYERGDWPDVLGDCYKAFEKLANSEGQAKDWTFRLLLDELYPGTDNAGRREKLNALILAFTKLCHELGRHATSGEARTTRAEAELGLRLTASVFSLLGQALSMKAANAEAAPSA